MNGKKVEKNLTSNAQKFGVQSSNLHKAKRVGEVPYLLRKQKNNKSWASRYLRSCSTNVRRMTTLV